MKCKICRNKTKIKKTITRSKTYHQIYFCKSCDFEFFKYNPLKNLSENKLNIFRLAKAGLKIPKKNEEFLNGTLQSKKYLKEYVTKSDKTKNILEVGCSLGYFLNLLKKNGHKNIYGLEINEQNRKFVQNKLKIRCERELLNYKKDQIFFDKIFLFYSLEYILDPLNFIKELLLLLKKNGKIIIITPNKNDILKNILFNISYHNFFYDINSINYFSAQSLKKISKKIPNCKFHIQTKQGYSLINLFNWFINNKPIKSKFVGEDNHYLDFLSEIKKNKKNNLDTKISKKIFLYFKQIDLLYRKKLSDYNYGNQIIVEIKKK